MRPFFASITFKLFFTILLTCLIVTLAMGLAIRYSFETGFDTYIQKREQQRLTVIADSLAGDYAEAGGWGGQDKKHWSRLLRYSNESSHRSHSVLRFTLMDDNGSYIAGARLRNDDSQSKVPVIVNDKTVGWVFSSSRLPKVINDEIDRQFQDRQLYATWVIIGFSVLLAIIGSLLLARYLLVPVKRLAQATESLANGDFDVHVKPRSKDELAQLAANFNKLAFNLKRNQKLRHDLMAEISHELRTPLAILRGEIEAMQDGLKEIDNTTLDSLLHEVKQLNYLIDDLYDLSLADAGALNYRMLSVDLSEVLNKQISLLKDRFDRHKLEITSEIKEGIYIKADEARIIQLINNLLENSLRYTNSPGRVAVSLVNESNNAIISFDDTEPGVPKDRLNNLFERFYRLEPSRNRAYGGSGLGLAIAKQIVLAHGGQITAVHSALNGLGIRISLPISKVTK